MHPKNFLSFQIFSSSDHLCESTSESSNLSDANATDASPKNKRRRKLSSQPVRCDSPPVQPRRIRLSQQNYAAISSDNSEGVRFGHLRRSCGLLAGEEELTHQDENTTDVEEDNSSTLNLPQNENTSPQPDPNQNTENQETVTQTDVNNDSSEMTNSVNIPNAQAEKYNDIPHTQSSNPETEDTYVDYRVTHVQGGGDTEQPQRSIDGAYSLVANSLKLSTV